MLRSIKRKTEAALRRRKTNKSINQITPVDVDWPIQSDSYPPSTSTEDRTATNTTEPEEELTPADQALQFRFKQDDTSVLHTPALEEVPAEDPVDEVDVAEQPGLGSYTTKYVPFVETSAMRSNMFVHSANSHYGMVNPAIMGGFGDDDDDSIWLVDDEETEEENEEVTTTVKRGENEEEDDVEEEELEEEEEEDEPAVALPPTNQPPPVSTVPEPASTASPDTGFRYRINLALFDDAEFAAPPKETVTVFVDEDENEDEDDILHLPSPSIDSAELLRAVNAFRRPGSSQDEIAASNGSSTPATSNPYVDLLEQQDSAMTVAYQRRLDLSGRRGDDEADDFSFGQRYQRDPGTATVLVTHQRVPSDHDSGDRDCSICTDTKEDILFPRFSPTASCLHPPTACLECLERSIRSDLTSKIWTDIRCPECREFLDYTDIQRYADEETFKRYETLALRAAMAEAENFFWCTSGCGSGQIHESGQDQPIVICLHCTHRSCFHHNVAWHQGLTCDEYDQLLADPDNFRSKLEIDNEAWAAAQEAQLEADRAMAQGLLEEERRVREMREMREREERERTRKAIELARQIAARRKAEEDMSRETVGRTTKPCPGCGWAIEKNDGCSHMTCVKCKHQFCYECGADHKQILEKDNTVHKEDCKFHPSQLGDLEESEVRDNDDDDGDDTEEGDFDEGDFEDEEDEEEEVIVIRGNIRRFK
ncbi:hypothetical protein CI102_4866 [Trichoderma harzianum]|uniref:RBR-type E3 ubiquitin transferase n=1 Tax=Trichoderma harzianum CBS 226.95 TaxID=983964 RepID=A0A2T4APF5_TRIHA|nr:hypothetical protein M431DRAFT_527571 [Trichoderma harzianum CBS 226.95]PKK50637.1 hypothetical protein CI102_4866 [Trichoderma harzianum]PTB58951.1 hypothetical protein M431DRAFT_527571 [Trichoderma harzianum CBS 226.95]